MVIAAALPIIRRRCAVVYLPPPSVPLIDGSTLLDRFLNSNCTSGLSHQEPLGVVCCSRSGSARTGSTETTPGYSRGQCVFFLMIFFCSRLYCIGCRVTVTCFSTPHLQTVSTQSANMQRRIAVCSQFATRIRFLSPVALPAVVLFRYPLL
eukprot:NODE_4075_length_819_cov_51.722543_g4052_i0.p1 GENE.NODE_4075_length_819_cov_51.722543_g4052_i0~~NODE_4075_length_819_cov_51.722543_g4052_i0.p1  ORF type:complete len:151 (+),score=2.28 NODE_4075_length_819_cov_51.722543_g4052_i0:212-664(+)